jgi:hypothetical protein
MALPNFLIIGAAKAGTSTLHTYLRAHPRIFMPARKELRFFAYDGKGDDYFFPAKSLEVYESYFAGATDEKALGEASPHYLRTPQAPRRIKDLIPGCNLIVSLRNPIERSFSSYTMAVRDRTIEGVATYTEALEKFPVFRRGYSRDLQNYFGIFDRSQIRIVHFEDIVRDPVQVAQSLCGFLGVTPDFAPDVQRVSNPGGLPKIKILHRFLMNKRVLDFGKRHMPEKLVEAAKNLRNSNLEKQEMTLKERQEALDIFRGDILKTQDIIGEDLSAWLRAPA